MGTAANIKLHHNVGGLPEDLGFELVEPLRDLFKEFGSLVKSWACQIRFGIPVPRTRPCGSHHQ